MHEIYYRWVRFPKENSCYSMKHQKKKELLLLTTKLIEKIPDANNAKQYCQTFLNRKNTKQVKRSKIIIQQPKTLENSNIADIESVTIEHPKTSRKLSKTPRQAKKVSLEGSGKSSNIPLYSETKKGEKYLDVKITKRSHAYKCYASSYNVWILNSSNPELQLKDTEYAIKNKLIDLSIELKDWKN